MGVEILVEFTGNKDVYHPDEVVSGNVILNCSEAQDFKALKLTLKGSAKVQWREDKTTYQGKEAYFTETFILKSGGNGQRIYSGRSSYPFQYRLPRNIPSSVEVPEGYIRYRAQVCLDLDKTFGSEEEEVFFTVIEERDLNLMPNARYPAAVSKSKKLSFLCCSSGSIEGRVNTQKTGFVPGEFVVANSSVDNQSNSDMSDCKLKIVQVITQHGRAIGFPFPRRSRQLRRTLVKQETPGKFCPRGSSVALDTQTIQIPPIPPSHQWNCKVMGIEHYLMLEVKTGMYFSNLRVMAPLEIGTIPLRDPGAQAPVYQALSAQVASRHEERALVAKQQHPTPGVSTTETSFDGAEM